jgi:hypothetical protein
MLDKQDSNQVGLFLARETNGELPDGSTFATREPNSYDKFGGDYKMVARNPFNVSRQNKKGTTSDLDTAGGWNEDVTQNNLFPLVESFFFAAMRRKAEQAVTAVVTPDDKFTVADSSGFTAGTIAQAYGFSNPANNGAKHVTASAAGSITVSEVLAAEAINVGDVKGLRVVGRKFAAGDCAMTLNGPFTVLTFTAALPNSLNLIPGEWVFLGGDLAATQFATVKPGYARVYAVDNVAKTITFDKTTFAPAADAGAAKTIELYFGFLVKNEDDEDLIVKYTYTAERPLGKDNDGYQSDNLSNFVLSQMKWNSPLSNKVTIDVTGVGLGYDTRTGAEGLLSKQGTNKVTKALGEEAFNTSVNVYRIRLQMIEDDGTMTPLFARCTEWTSTINNNVTASKSQGTLGGFDTTVGQFDVSTTITAYFQTVAPITTIRENSDCTFDAIYTKENAAIIYDLPLVSTGGGALTIAQNQPIMMPLTNSASENQFGYTALLNFLPYVPTVGMSTGAR